MDVKTLGRGVLSRGATSGYEIKKQCEKGLFDHCYAEGFGSIYPALSTSLNDRLISLEEANQTGRPSKKIYSIKPAGHQVLSDEMLPDSAPDRPRSDFILIMFCRRMLPARDSASLIEERIVSFRDRLTKIYQNRREPILDGERFALGFGISVCEAGAQYLENHRHELVGAALRNEAGAAGYPPCSAHNSEA